MSVAFVSCPAFEKEKSGVLPQEIREPEPARDSHPFKAITRRYGGVVGIILNVMLIWISRPWLEQWQMNEVPPGIYTPPASATPTALANATATLHPSPTALPTSRLDFFFPTAPEPTTRHTTPSPTPGPSLETPFDRDPSYLLHRVQTGESYGKLAAQYATSQEILQAVNLPILDFGLQPGLVIVILPEHTGLTNLRPLRAVLTETETYLSDLASQYGVTIQEIHTYNHLGRGETIPAVRWLIIPERWVTPSATPTTTAVPDLRGALTDPFGPDNRYILHRVKTGESMASLEARYRCFAEVIRQSNLLTDIVQVDQVLVIPINQTDPAGVQPFRVVQITADISLATLASQLNIEAADLAYYNGFEINDTLPAGQWVIIPVFPEP